VGDRRRAERDEGGHHPMRYRFAAAVLGMLALPVNVSGQSMRDACVIFESASYEALCVNLADAMRIIPPKVGIALSGGNPVPGTASTLGMRLGALPRMSLAVRATGTFVDVPQIEEAGNNGNIEFGVGTIAADASIGVFQGFALLPTVGGFGSIDLLGSAGVMVTRRDAFHSSPFTWAAGVRLGLLRESFTAPGVSLSAMYRKVGNIEYGNVDTGLLGGDEDAFFDMRDYQVISLRGVVGKRFVGLGVTAGVGYDRYRTDVLIRVRDPAPLAPNRIREIFVGDLKTNRTSLFANASYTVLLLSFVAEAGWQLGGSADPGESDMIEKGTFFSGLALRIGI
jgi:hypothetical protein